MATLDQTVRVRRRVELFATSAEQLRLRLQRFQNALRAQSGNILKLDWEITMVDGREEPTRARIVYQLPLTKAGAMGGRASLGQEVF